MNRSPASRSDHPSRVVGPLVSALVIITALSLGGSVVGADATTTIARAEPAGSEQAQPDGGPSGLELRPPSETAPAGEVDPSATPSGAATTLAPKESAPDRATPGELPDVAAPTLPDIPVVDARLRRQRPDKGNQPIRIQIDSVDIDVEVRPTGVAEDGSMELPDTVRRAGWYRFSSPPGARTGSTVVAAHVDTRKEGLGPFARLASIRQGSAVTLLDRDGKQHRYRIESRRYIARQALPVDEIFERDGKPRLVLLTCGGAYDSATGYRDNVVVVGTPDR
ncbi:MAG: sortase [Microlunatus sp.]|nr:sortase [Microlunatus sp.]